MVNTWHLIGIIRGSSYRKKIFLSLSTGEKTPTQLVKDVNIKMSHISRALKELQEEKLIACLTPKLRKHKIYGLTDLGKAIREKVGWER